MEKNDNSRQLDLYTLNKQFIKQLPDFGELEWESAEKIFYDWLEEKTSQFYMLYGKELSYFTVFQKKSKDAEFRDLYEALIECLNFVGVVKSLDISSDGAAIEIWVKLRGEEEVSCLYLFEYDEGVVTYHG